jgi:SAM-dependent methyltransferase
MNDEANLAPVRQAMQQTWSKGDFSVVAGIVVTVAEDLAEALDIVPGERVLDVACGSGNGAVAAARRAWGNTVGTDFVPELLERGRERAAAERLEIDFVEGDAADLPFEQAEFDVVMSIFGAMFAPEHEKTAAELMRVCKSGGRIGMANWVPDGFVGEMFKTSMQHAPPPVTITPPSLWGTEDHLRELFGDGITDLQLERRTSVQRFASADHWLEVFKTYFGPTMLAFERVGTDGEAALEEDLRALLQRYNRAGDRALVLEADYLQMVATRA